jgi:ketosteroid isomerase-like protein
VTDPVTVFGARGQSESGTQPVTATFRRVAGWFSVVQDYNWETIASGVSGDMAYTVCIERYTASVECGPPTRTELRSTHVFRRENGQWLAVHRHADRRPPDAPVK